MLRLLDLLSNEMLLSSNVQKPLQLLAIVVRAHEQLLHTLTIFHRELALKSQMGAIDSTFMAFACHLI